LINRSPSHLFVAFFNFLWTVLHGRHNSHSSGCGGTPRAADMGATALKILLGSAVPFMEWSPAAAVHKVLLAVRPSFVRHTQRPPPTLPMT